jgi:hypothetical protein
MAALSRLDDLRIKTGEQLVRLVNSYLNHGIREAHQALVSADAGTFAEDHHLRAKRAYAVASRLIPSMGGVPEHERSGWDIGLERLREMLDQLSVLGLP